MRPYYEHAGITIYQGDCREILPQLGCFDVIVTDPPYGLGDKWSGGKVKWRLHHGQMDWDSFTVDGLEEMLLGAAKQIVVWGGHLYNFPACRGWLVWDKIVREFTSGHCEIAWTNLDQPIRAFSYSHGALASEGKFHPTQKPLPLMKWAIGFTEGEICDPYMGSGTTLVAAKDQGRKATGIELNERYCEIAAKRLSQEVLFPAGVTA